MGAINTCSASNAIPRHPFHCALPRALRAQAAGGNCTNKRALYNITDKRKSLEKNYCFSHFVRNSDA
jgi:hypothetical protein